MAQLDPRQVVAAGVRDVERVQEHRHSGPASPVGIADVHPPLQAREARPVALERDDLAVHHEVASRLAGEDLLDLGVLGVHRRRFRESRRT
jgi:hypothetical protein